jgi:hypothetical protein
VPELNLNQRFDHHPPDEATGEIHAAVRAHLKRAAESVVASQPDSRERSLAVTHLEEAMFWANAGIARNGTAESAWRLREMAVPTTEELPTPVKAK